MSDSPFSLRFSPGQLMDRFDKSHDGYVSTPELIEMPPEAAVQLFDQQFPVLDEHRLSIDINYEESIAQGLAGRLAEMPDEWLGGIFERCLNEHGTARVPRHSMVDRHFFYLLEAQHRDAGVNRYANIVLASKSPPLSKETVQARLANWVDSLGQNKRDQIKDAVIKKLREQMVGRTFEVDFWLKSHSAGEDPNKLRNAVIGKLMDLLDQSKQAAGQKPTVKHVDPAKQALTKAAADAVVQGRNGK